jgi:predicted metal-dependent phosphoesterase TrpH
MNNLSTVRFEEPDINKINQRHTVVDMHVHTLHSDGQNTVAQIAKRAKELGIGVAITDHNEIQGAIEMDTHKDVLSIPGIEITSREGTHILVYFYSIQSLKRFYKRDIAPNMGTNIMRSTALSIESIVSRARKFKSVIIFPHPYSAAYTGICNHYFGDKRLKKILAAVDGVEAINAENLNKWNLKSTVLGFNLSKGMTGGSDAHKLDHIGGVVSYADCRASTGHFLDAVKTGQTQVVGKEIAMLHKVSSNGAKLKTNWQNCHYLIEKNAKYSYSLIQNRSLVTRNKAKERLGRIIQKRGFKVMLNSSWFRLSHNLALLVYTLPTLLR